MYLNIIFYTRFFKPDDGQEDRKCSFYYKQFLLSPILAKIYFICIFKVLSWKLVV